MPFVRRSMQINIKRSHKLYTQIDQMAFKCKNLYNFALYQERQKYFKDDQFWDYTALNTLCRDREDNQDYRALPAQTSIGVIKQVAETCLDYYKACVSYSRDKTGFTGHPKLPHYKDKNGRSSIPFTNQQVKVRNGYLVFPKPLQDLRIKFNKQNVRSVIITFKGNSYAICVSYLEEIGIQEKPLTWNLLGIDIGVDNFATVVSTTGDYGEAFIINGKGLKSYNKYFNKKLAYLKSRAKKENDKYVTRQILALYSKRDFVVKDFIHKASRKIVDYAIAHDISAVVIGKNVGWKQRSRLSKRVNQTFIQLPFAKFIDVLTYKLQAQGIAVYITEESYTSGTSFLDGEPPIKELYDKSRRIHRGLFKTNNNLLINADVNGACQIIKKVFTDFGCTEDVVEAVRLTPTRVNVMQFA